MTRIIPLVMCGGAGTRLWPASRENMPKQFIGLFGDRSTFQDTILRVSDPAIFDRPIIVSHEAYRSMVVEQLAAIGAEADILLEPCRRDSGPAILSGTLRAMARRADAVVLALAADHVVKYPDRFRAACTAGLEAVAEGRILTFGVRPDGPSSEYGYIQPEVCDSTSPCEIVRFVEKPDRVTAERYLADGYLWNSGNFMFRADVLLDEYRWSDPETVAAVGAALGAAFVGEKAAVLERSFFEQAKSCSIDYAVMEKTSLGSVLGISIGWSDVGSWEAVWELSAKDPQQNASKGPAVFEEAHNCVVLSDGATVAVQGLDDVVVVVRGDAILVSRRGSNMKALVGRLRQAAPEVLKAAS